MMNKLARCLMVVTSLLSLTSLASAEPPEEKKARSEAVASRDIVFYCDEGKRGPSRLIIPESFLNRGLVANLGSSLRTVIAGLAIAIAVGMMIFFRRRGTSAAMLGGLCVGAGMVGMSPLLFADVAPHPGPYPVAQIIVEVSDTEKQIVLHLNRADRNALAKMIDKTRYKGPARRPDRDQDLK